MPCLLFRQDRRGSIYDLRSGQDAIRSLATTLTAELSANGIRVNAIAPGLIDTDLTRGSGWVKTRRLSLARTIGSVHGHSMCVVKCAGHSIR